MGHVRYTYRDTYGTRTVHVRYTYGTCRDIQHGPCWNFVKYTYSDMYRDMYIDMYRDMYGTYEGTYEAPPSESGGRGRRHDQQGIYARTYVYEIDQGI